MIGYSLEEACFEFFSSVNPNQLVVELVFLLQECKDFLIIRFVRMNITTYHLFLPFTELLQDCQLLFYIRRKSFVDVDKERNLVTHCLEKLFGRLHHT